MQPLVSCICPTYGRCPDHQHLLEEAVESFLRQDYPHKELIVLHDAAEQELVCEERGVSVINLARRVMTLGGKYNVGIQAAEGEIILPWEDDDVSLPWRISQAVERLEPIPWGQNSLTTPAPHRVHYWNPQRSWFLAPDGLHRDHTHGVCHNASAYLKWAWHRVHGYAPLSGAQDADMDRRLRDLGLMRPPLTEDASTWSYVYRWGVSPNHLSGYPDPEGYYARPRAVPAGRFVLRPHWRQDYVALTRAALAAA